MGTTPYGYYKNSSGQVSVNPATNTPGGSTQIDYNTFKSAVSPEQLQNMIAGASGKDATGKAVTDQGLVDALNGKTGMTQYNNVGGNIVQDSTLNQTPQQAAQNAQVLGARQSGTALDPNSVSQSGPTPVPVAPGLPTLANGQQAGGLQMPTGNATNSVLDPISGKQISPSEAAFNATKAGGTPPPQDSATGVSTATGNTKTATPANPTTTTTPNVDNFFNPQTNPTLQDTIKQLTDYFNPEATNKILTDQLAKISSDNATLAGLNTQDMNIQNVMSGTEDDLRKEIQAVGGFATDSQVKALAIGRNQTLLKQDKLIQMAIQTAQNAVANDTTLFQNEKDMANTQFSQRTTIYQLAQKNQQDMQQAAKDGAKTIIDAIGFKGYLDSLQGQGPSAVSAGEKALGLSPGGLTQLVQAQQTAQNKATIENSGATTPFVNKNGEIQSQTGYAYTSPQDFFNKTGMTLEQAQGKGMISTLQPSLDIQQKKANVEKAQADVAMAPLDRKLKEAQISNVYSEIGKRNADMAAATANDAAVNPDVLQGMLNVYKSTGVLPPFGLSAKSPLRAQFFAALGGAGGGQIVADANTNKAVKAGLTTALTTQQNQFAANQTAIQTLDKQLTLAQSYSDKVGRIGSPLANKYLLWAKGQGVGDADTAALNNIVTTASYEFAKILSGSAASISGVSISSADDAKKMLNSAMSKGQFNEVIGLMKKEADFRLKSQQDTIGHLETDISNVGDLTTSLNSPPTTFSAGAPLGVGSGGTFSSGITWKIIQ